MTILITVKTSHLAALVLLLLCATPTSLGACECVQVAPFTDAAKDAAILFTGKVVATHFEQ